MELRETEGQEAAVMVDIGMYEMQLVELLILVAAVEPLVIIQSGVV